MTNLGYSQVNGRQQGFSCLKYGSIMKCLPGLLTLPMNIPSRQLSRQTEYYNHSVVKVPIIVIALLLHSSNPYLTINYDSGPKSISKLLH